MTEDQVRDLIRDRSRRFATKRRGSTGVTAWGQAHGVARSHLSEFMGGKRAPTTDILDALNLEWRIVRKGSARAVSAPERLARLMGCTFVPAAPHANVEKEAKNG